MRTITAYRIILQFDANQITKGTASAQVEQAVDLINLTLQREPFGLAAQLIIDEDHDPATDIDTTDLDEDED